MGTIAPFHLTDKMAHDDLVCPPSVSACDHPARRSALCAKLASRSRRAEGFRGEEVLDRRELPDALGCPGRALILELILVRLTILGVSFDLLAFESREMAAYFIGRKHTPHFRDKSRKLPGESRMLRGGAGEIHQFLSDRIVKRRLKPKALSDGSSRFALLDPNLMMIARTHSLLSLQSC